MTAEVYTPDKERLAAIRESMFNSQLHKLRLLAEKIQGRLERYDIGAPQVVVLLALCAADDMEPAQIADQVLIPRQTITSILDKLEKAGLVVRTEHPTDRRRKVIRLTQAGFEKACEVWNDLDAYETQIKEAFTKREIELYKRLNLKLAGRLKELD
jgi:DNA-binding MarR family transcriptional regulator